MKTKRTCVILACTQADGTPAIVRTFVYVTRSEFTNREHIDRAMDLARAAGFDAPYVAFCEEEGPDWLFSDMEAEEPIEEDALPLGGWLEAC
jgi:hypothetical protein